MIDASVIIATRDRLASLKRTLDALRAQETTATWELIVVDDGSEPPVPETELQGLGARLLRGEGRGPATARNLGLREARGDVVLFTDDDTEPDPGWLQAGVDFFRDHPDHVGAEGPVRSPPYDPLFAHSIESHAPGFYITANSAYRRDVLERIGGFFESFPTPHCEDVDLAYRAQAHGPMGWAAAMSLSHHPRRLTVRELGRRGRMMSSEAVLVRRHPQRYGRAGKLPARLFPVLNAFAYWRVLAHEARTPARALRAAAVALLVLAHTIVSVARAR